MTQQERPGAILLGAVFFVIAGILTLLQGRSHSGSVGVASVAVGVITAIDIILEKCGVRSRRRNAVTTVLVALTVSSVAVWWKQGR